jgi:hypothetical protein
MDVFLFILKEKQIPFLVKKSIDSNSENLWLINWNDVKPDIISPKKYISINTEPLSVEHCRNNLKYRLSNSLLVIDFTYCNSVYYKEWGCNYFILPFGYSKLFEKNFPVNKKDIDILFYGSMNKHRCQLFSKLKHYCEAKNLKLVIRGNDLYDEEEKRDIISRSKVVLSIKSRNDIISNDTIRLSFLATNKVFVIAEKHGDEEIESKLPLTYFENFDDLLLKLSYFLENEKEREKVSTEVYNYIKKEMNMVDNFKIPNSILYP